MATSTPMLVPSRSLLRAFLKPSPAPCIQVRHDSNWMPREKFTKPSRLSKLHRRQKEAVREEKLASHARALEMSLPSTTTPPSDILEDSSPSPPTTSLLAASTLPYQISRTNTPSHSLPIYQSSKSGGNLHLTTLRRCSGDLSTLKTHLLQALGLVESYIDKKGRKKENVAVNKTTRAVVVRGWRAPEVRRWCEMVGF